MSEFQTQVNVPATLLTKIETIKALRQAAGPQVEVYPIPGGVEVIEKRMIPLTTWRDITLALHEAGYRVVKL